MLRVRWLGRVHYRDAHALQRALWERSRDGHLLLLEHPHVFTMGTRAKPEHVLVDPATVGAELVDTDRGGDVTYHGPGQLVGYPIVDVPLGHNAIPGHVHGVEQLVIDALAELGLPGAGRLDGYPGVWFEGRKICAIGVRVSKERSMHGFALNVDPDMEWFTRIVPCGIDDKPVTSLAAEGVHVSMHTVVDVVTRLAAERWGSSGCERTDVAWERDDARTVETLPIEERKPEWVRVKAEMGAEYRGLKKTMRSLELVTVCEEAGCPNVYECWAEGTATFMINGDRCTRACGFCLVDTRKPMEIDPVEPHRVAEAVERMGLSHAVVTAVARDDVPDGGATAFAATIDAIRLRCPSTAVEVLIPDCKGDASSLDAIFSARPDVLNHNLETVARLQRVVRPSASYARSLAVLARSAAQGLTTKSGLMVGLGETEDEVLAALADLRAVGVDIVTIGQYLRPTASHLPVARWWTPAEFDRLRDAARAMDFAHVQASPLTRSSYHAREAAGAASPLALS
ncbi:MAG: lipoyl synthase [Actinomycetota bacterium]|nr:lipoyl synthase [Actinomycetota bacterium]